MNSNFKYGLQKRLILTYKRKNCTKYTCLRDFLIVIFYYEKSGGFASDSVGFTGIFSYVFHSHLVISSLNLFSIGSEISDIYLFNLILIYLFID